MIRVRRVLAAMKQAEMVRLAAARQAAARRRSQARALRHASTMQQVPETGADMLATARWQTHAVAKARTAEAEAEAIDNAAAPLAVALARTIGRESVVDQLIADHERSEAELRARRAEG